MGDEVPTPADFLGHAGHLEAQAQDIKALHDRLRAAEDAPTRRVGFRLEDIAGELRKAARGLQQTAEDLARIRSRNAMSRARVRRAVGRLPGARQHPFELGWAELVHGAGVWPHLGLGSGRPALHRGCGMAADRSEGCRDDSL